MRVALLTNILAPYRAPVFRALAETPGWRLRIFTNAATEVDRPWSVDPGTLDVEIVRSLAFSRGGRTVHLPLGLPAALRRFAPEVVVSGELGARTFLAWLYCALARTPLVIWSYPTRVTAAATPTWRRALARFLLGRAGAVIGMGRQAREALEAWGVAGERLFDAPNAHDHEDCLKALAASQPGARERALRAALGCRARIALVVGRLVPVKGIAELLDGWDRLAPELRDDWTLLFVGSGPLEEAVRRARDTHRPGEIAQVPWIEPPELIEFYAAADLLVFASLADTWGLVVNEALACGLPVLCSRRAGCADDLVREGENGWLFDPTDGDDIARGLRRALTCGRRRHLAAAAREAAERCRPELMAEGMRRAVGHATARAGDPAPDDPAVAGPPDTRSPEA